MHRGLVKTIISAIDTTKLRSLRLDYLDDQGALPAGDPMNSEVAEDFAKSARQVGRSDEEYLIDNALFQRQERGEAAMFPGPMWYPMRLLSDCSLDSLSHFRLTIPHFDMHVDVRNYYSSFHEATKLLRRCASSLRSLVVVFRESTSHHYPQTDVCGTSRVYYGFTYRPWCVKLAATFLKQLLIALSECSYPNLTQLTFEGFSLLGGEEAEHDPGGPLAYVQQTRFGNVDFTGASHVDGRQTFRGFECDMPGFDEGVLRNS